MAMRNLRFGVKYRITLKGLVFGGDQKRKPTTNTKLNQTTNSATDNIRPAETKLMLAEVALKKIL